PPAPLIREEVQTIPGLDGRKMSKSYGNTVPLFAPREELRKRIMQIRTDSSPVEAVKNPDAAPVFQLYRHFASPEQAAALRARLATGGTGWQVAKDALLGAVEHTLAEPRRVYKEWMARPDRLHEVLAQGGAWARERAERRLREVRRAVGTDHSRPGETMTIWAR
ncbi:MAG: tryptophan--tRNA ligase, partial [Terriglobales bacterium]